MLTHHRTLGAIVCLFVALGLCGGTGAAEGALPAFPGAEGFGAFTPGGRGGTVLLITTLEDYDPANEAAIPGSLREAVAAEGARIIVFRVGGNIKLKARLVVTNPYITIAGQTAPGGGVCLTTYPLIIGTHDVIVRHLRVRLGDETKAELGTVDVFDSQNVIVDHCSVTWAIDECFSVTGLESRNITVQWCIIAEGLNRSFHPKGEHGHGSLLRSGGGGMTLHHNVYAHNYSRSPRPGSYPDSPGLLLDFRNNLIYNWGKDAGYSGEHRLRMNYVNNYLKPGPSTRESQRRYAFSVGGTKNSIFIAGNHLDGYPDATEDNWLMVRPSSRLRGMEGWDGDLRGIARAPRPHPAPPIALQSPEDAYRSILRGVGATLPARDALDRRLVREIKTGTGTIIDSQDEVGGWPQLRSGRAPRDSDLDGMPDRWERRHRLLVGDPADNAGDADGDGYTNIEEYLNGTDPQVRDRIEAGFSFPDILAQVDTLNAEARREIEAEKRELAGRQTERAGASLEASIEPAPDGLPESVTVRMGDEVEMSMRLIPAGTFTMGSPEDEEGRDPDETQHTVRLSRPFYMGATSVTREQFTTAFGKSLDDPVDAEMPVTRVTWLQAVEFCEILSRATDYTFRLPTEAEWEYACRAGTQTPFNTGRTITTDQANFNGEYVYGNGTPGVYRRSAMPVGCFPPNAWGLYDMHGNVFEWCSDWYGEYPTGSVTDPTGPEAGRHRVIRGGNHGSHPRYVRSASRYRYRPVTWFGFRVVMEVR